MIMRRSAAALGSAAFFLAAPGMVAGLVPWLITGWKMPPASGSAFAVARVAVGASLSVIAVLLLVRNFIRFVTEGRGTPSPTAPPERLVVGGDYRFVRNPMYVAVVSVVLGQALIFGSVTLLIYAVMVWAIMAAFVRYYEEPRLRRRYGNDYEDYRTDVPAWIPLPRRHRNPRSR